MIRLLSTDFDGTLVEHRATPPVSPGLFPLLGELRRSGVVWALNTGRDLALALEGLREFGFPLMPDYILTMEREIFHHTTPGGWQDYGDWNRRCREAHDRLFRDEAAVHHEVLRFVREETTATVIYEESPPCPEGLPPGKQPSQPGQPGQPNNRIPGAPPGFPSGVVAPSVAELERVVAHLHRVRPAGSAFHYQRNEVYLRFCHAGYSKGAALEELGRLLRIPAEERFAVGDQHNDLSMLDGLHARHPAAPGNATPEVKEAVRKAGGYVARANASGGVVEALRHFMENPLA